MDKDGSLKLIKMVPLSKRQDWVAQENECLIYERDKKIICGRKQICSCRLEQHFQKNHRNDLRLQNKWSISCPFCPTAYTDQCTLLQHIFMTHKNQKQLAMEALKERQHFDGQYTFIVFDKSCTKCKR